MKKWFVAAAVFIVAAVCLPAYEESIPGLVRPSIDNGNHQVKLAARHLAVVVKPEDRAYTRFFTLQGLAEELKERFRRMFFGWLLHLSFEKGYPVPEEVKGSSKTLYAIDLRDYGWNAGSWRAVAFRDKKYTEPLLSNKETEYLRREAGIRQDKDTLHSEMIVPAWWFFRDTIEGDLSPSYYDLLYSKFRFLPKSKDKTIDTQTIEEKKEAVKVWKTRYFPAGYYDGVYWEAGNYEVQEIEYVTKKVAKDTKSTVKVEDFDFVDFPKDKDDFDKAFGVDKIKEFLKQSKLDTSHGSIAAGMTEDGKGSYVARSNRLLLFRNGVFGVNYESFDVEKATGKKDYLEQSVNISKGIIEFDAQELLYALPNGAQACLLTNGAGKRVELAAGRVAVGPAKDFPQVRNPGDCIFCHAPTNGLINPQNLVAEFIDAGGDVKIKEKKKFTDFLAFYLDNNDRMKSYTTPYDILIKRATREDPTDRTSKSFTGAQFAKEFDFFRRKYDEPVTVAQAALELGVPAPIFKGLCVQLGTARAQNFVLGKPCPRPAFDTDVFPKIALLLAADRE